MPRPSFEAPAAAAMVSMAGAANATLATGNNGSVALAAFNTVTNAFYIRDTGYEKISAGHCTAVEQIAWKTASQAAQSFLNKASNEASGVLSTALSFLSLYRDPIVAANTSGSDFTIESLMQRRTSLYLVVPPSDKDRLKPLLRLVINQAERLGIGFTVMIVLAQAPPEFYRAAAPWLYG